MSALSALSTTSDKFIAIYRGPGAASGCVKDTEALLQKHLPTERFQYLDTDLSTIFKNHVSDKTIIVLPGGNAGTMIFGMETQSHKAIFKRDLTQFLETGGCVHGTCAGAIMLSPGLYVQYGKFPFEPIHLFDGTLVGNQLGASAFVPMHYDSKERQPEEYCYADIKLVNSPIFPELLRGKIVRCVDADSPGWLWSFTDTIAGIYTNLLGDKPMSAILTKNVKKGKIWAQGPHLEFMLEDPTKGVLTAEEQALREELFYHSFRTLGLKI